MPSNNHKLEQLRQSYSSALYSYFRIRNLDETYEGFLKDPSQPPVFVYSPNLTIGKVNQRLAKLHSLIELLDSSNQAEIAFLEWRVAETLILKQFLQLSTRFQVSAKFKAKYLQAQVDLYGEVDEKIFGGVVHSLHRLARRRGETYVLAAKKIESQLGDYIAIPLFAPKEKTFLHYKHLFVSSFPALHKVLLGIHRADRYSLSEIITIFQRALVAVGADKKGWRVVVREGGANIIAAKYRRKIIISNNFHPSSTYRFKQIVAHEVGCHVQRALPANLVDANFEENDEGLAILLEQLLGPRYMLKRALRYFAIGLAIGVDGKPRDFCEVYDILWRAVYITNQDKRLAQKQAFYETARVFRGGLPAVAGIAYIKDKIYLESNLALWRKLEDNKLSVNQFKKLFRAPTETNVGEINK